MPGLTLLVQVTRPIRDDTTHSSVVFNFCVAVGNWCSKETLALKCFDKSVEKLMRHIWQVI